MSLRSSLLVALVLSGSVLAPQAGAQAADAPLPFDSTVLRGRLPNGLRYLIRRNTLPEKRAELRLVVDAGSILEDEPQLGVAHFVEHMAFNGTRRFPKADLVNFLERIGVRFGPDLNAYTSFDETVYMLQIPTDTAAIVSKALDILEDWAHGLALDSTEIRKERGVVVEEWRSGRGAQMRMTYKQFPVILRGSKYATRLPIGTRENLQSFPDSVARAFYRDWYRPDLMTVVAVGDFDPKRMEADVRQRFARIPAVRKPRTREYAQVPGHEETLRLDRVGQGVSERRGHPRLVQRAEADAHHVGVPPLARERLARPHGERAPERDLPAPGRALRVRRHGSRLVHPHARRAAAVRGREGKRLREGR